MVDARQLSLVPIAARRDPATSHEAAAAITGSGLRAAQAQAVLALLRAHPGATAGELACRTHALDRVQIARRLCDLRAVGLARQGEIARRGGRRAEVTWWPT